MDESRQILARLALLEEFVESLKSSHSIPFDVDSAFRDRLSVSATFDASTKDANSEDVTINEAGSGTSVVLNDPTGFVKARLSNGTEVALPYYSV